MLSRSPKFFLADRRRNAVLLVASAALHVLVLTPLALRWIADEPLTLFEPTPAPILLQIEARPLIEGERPQPRPVATPETIAPPVDPASPTHGRTPIVRTPEDKQEETPPTPPVPRRPAALPMGSLAYPAADPWRVRPNDTAGRVAQSLRNGPVGCRMIENLTSDERAACDRTFGQAASEAAPIEGTGNAGRDNRFAREGAAALARYEARRAPLAGGVGVTGISGDCAGGNLRGNCPGEFLREGFRHEEDRVRQPRPPN